MAFSFIAAAAEKRAMQFLLLTAVFAVVLSGSNGAKSADSSFSAAAAKSLNISLPCNIPPPLCNFTAGQGNFKNFLRDLFLGIGHQEYTYNGTAWVNTNVSAVLYDNQSNIVAHHFFIPPPGVAGAVATWERVDPPSRVTALATVKIPQTTAVPLLLLDSKFNTGSNVSSSFEQVTNVQRLATVSGLPPTYSGNYTGETFKSQYSALYAFYHVK